MNFAFRSGCQADYPAISNFLEPQYKSDGSSNDGKYANPEVDRLLEEAAAETDTAKANDLYKQAQEIMVDELPAIPMWVPMSSYAWNPEVSGVDMMWNGTFDYAPMKKG